MSAADDLTRYLGGLAREFRTSPEDALRYIPIAAPAPVHSIAPAVSVALQILRFGEAKRKGASDQDAAFEAHARARVEMGDYSVRMSGRRS